MRQITLVLAVVSGMVLMAGVASAEHGRYGSYSAHGARYGGHYAAPRHGVSHHAYRPSYGHHVPHAARHYYEPPCHRSYRPYVPPVQCAPVYPRQHFGYHGNGFSIHLGF